MMYRRMTIGSVRRCPCKEHAWVVLHPRAGGTHLGLRVQKDFAALLRPKDAQLAAVSKRLFDGLAAIVRGLGQDPIAVIVAHEGRRISVRLRFSAGGAETDLECEPGVALLAAERIDLPVLLAVAGAAGRAASVGDDPAAADIPEVYRETLAALGLLGECSC